MNNIQTFSDKAAIGLSLLCTLHCIAIPIILLTFPVTAALPLQNEAFHFWMVVVVVPVSIYALTLGCKKHNRLQLLGIGLAGLLCLIVAVVLGEHTLGEMGEKALTMLGASIIAVGHYRNYTLCKHSDACKLKESEA